MSDVTKKKRPSKFNFANQNEGSQFNEQLNLRLQSELIDAYETSQNRNTPELIQPGSTSDESPKLDTSVRITTDKSEHILIKPSNIEVIQQLGRGQYGIVEEIRHLESGNHFAVKRVALKPGDDHEQSRLLMDVDILVKSTVCKNIIRFFGALLWEGDLWVVMELMDCSLHKFYRLAHRKVDTPVIAAVDAKKQFNTSPMKPCSHLSELVQLGECDLCNPIPELVLGRMASDIVSALNYLYSIKVIHRDVKPSNILINREGCIKLCDFGISGYLKNSVARTYEAGCRPYMAPERIDPKRDRIGYDIKSDVWSFGITMLEIATGRYPYQNARGFFEQIKSICRDEPPRLPEGRFTPIFEDFICQCLQKDYIFRPKYDLLELHPFVSTKKDHDIRTFAEKILQSEVNTV